MANSDNEDLTYLRGNGGPYGLLFGRSDVNLAASTSVIEGLPDEQRTSPVRRTFLLAILFDLILSFILWIIYVQQSITTGDINTALGKEVINYKFSTSLFDTLILSLLRFLVLEITYGALQSCAPWWSAGVTGLTSAVLVVKCFIFDFHQGTANSSGLAYTVIIAPLILVWLETCFLIYRVIPQERAATHVASYLKSELGETTSLMHSRFGPSINWYTSYAGGGVSLYSRSAGFHTPQGSLFGDGTIIDTQKPLLRESAIDVAAVLNRASLLQSEMWQLYNLDVWENELDKSFQHAQLLTYPSKVYRMEAMLHAPARVIFDDLVVNVHQTPSWNRTVSSIEVIQSLTLENIDIIHNTLHDSVGGLISPRDFVLLRSWGEKDQLLFVCSTSVEHPKCPPLENYIRAEQLISACIFVPSPEEPNSCRIIWFLCNDLKLSIPQRFVDRALNFALPTLLKGLIERSKSLTGGKQLIKLSIPIASSQSSYEKDVNTEERLLPMVDEDDDNDDNNDHNNSNDTTRLIH